MKLWHVSGLLSQILLAVRTSVAEHMGKNISAVQTLYVKIDRARDSSVTTTVFVNTTRGDSDMDKDRLVNYTTSSAFVFDLKTQYDAGMDTVEVTPIGRAAVTSDTDPAGSDDGDDQNHSAKVAAGVIVAIVVIAVIVVFVYTRRDRQKSRRYRSPRPGDPSLSQFDNQAFQMDRANLDYDTDTALQNSRHAF